MLQNKKYIPNICLISHFISHFSNLNASDNQVIASRQLPSCSFNPFYFHHQLILSRCEVLFLSHPSLFLFFHLLIDDYYWYIRTDKLKSKNFNIGANYNYNIIQYYYLFKLKVTK